MVHMLLDAGASSDLNNITLDNKTPLDYAIEWRKDDIAALLRQLLCARHKGGKTGRQGGGRVCIGTPAKSKRAALSGKL
jgi:hypothetical protein